MKFLKMSLCAVLCVLLLAGCAKMPETDFSKNSPLLIGTWQLIDYTLDQGKEVEWAKDNIVWADEEIVFTYNADGTGVKTVKGQTAYTFTYSFDGKYLYTTATYPDGRTALMKDIVTVEGDKVTTYSYDEKATITFQRKKTATTTTTTVTIITTEKEVTPIKPTSAPTTVPTTTKKPTTVTPTTSATKKVVQGANPETGISWDGVSPIIYTYTDGTTGTEPRNGAKYEYTPGVFRKIYTDKANHDPHCSKCGKIRGDGKNGTCHRWLMSDVNCPNCGEYVKVYECHTCQ